MKRNLAALLLFSVILILFGPFSAAYPALMTDYCQNPPLIPTPIAPNILFVVDTSGSMQWCGYYANASSSTPCDTTTTNDSNGNPVLTGYNPNTGYEGYFDPEKYYTLVSGVYQENPNPGATCTCTCTTWSCKSSNSGGCDPKGTHGCSSSRYACCTAKTCTGACTQESGNYLNYAHMERIDLLRWALTGGTPASCTTSDPNYCDPELYKQAGNTSNGKVGTVCSDTLSIDGASELGGCIIESDDGTQVKVPWARVNDSLAYQFNGLPLMPRLGAMFFNTSGVINSQLVYVGDATTAANTINLNYPYMNFITHVNATTVTGGTPTGPAMWDAYNYFAQNTAQYGGFTPMAVGSTTNYWRNPMYVCDQTGLSCTFVPCAGNYAILVSDGQWNTPSCSIGTPPTCSPTTPPSSTTNPDPVVPAYCMHEGFTNKSAATTPLTTSKVNGVYTIGLFMGGTGVTAMENIAMYGAFDNTVKLWPSSTTGFPLGSCSMTDCGSGKGSGCTAMPASSPDWDKNANGVPDTFYPASNALEIKDSVIGAILDILQQATSGTAVSILASGEGNGANLLQAFFYPTKSFLDADVAWVGEMQNLWYYLDPKLQVSTIREDTDLDKRLELKNDNVVHFRFDTSLNKTRADLYKDTAGDGSSLSYQTTVDLEQTKNLWEVGSTLWSRNLSTSPRTLYTTTNGSSLLSGNFSTSNAHTLSGYLQAASDAEAANIINYIQGTDVTGYRPRTVTISGLKNVWKLGDIVSSTPKAQSWIKLNAYDLDAPNGYGDLGYKQYVSSFDYQGRGMAYVGANDGMLHAFKLGTTLMSNDLSDKFLISQVCSDSNHNGKCDSGETAPVDLGKEIWTFIPKNSLPYLKYLTDPNYCHLYYVDATPYLFDASINVPSNCTAGDATCPRQTQYVTNTQNLDLGKTSWRTILIGGMGQGGACRQTAGTCNSKACSSTVFQTCNVNSDCPVSETCLPTCVKTPATDPADNTKSLGYSSYFALDITDPQNPSLLWEFSDPALGFSTSGPAVVRVSTIKTDGTPDKTTNGNWYVVLASGPTGPINTGLRQFMGESDQNLKLFILNMKTGALVKTIDTGLTNAFAGSLMNAPIDTDRWNVNSPGNYQDDVLYLGYTQKSGGNWVGGVLRVTTKESDPSNWTVSTLISGTGPVTSAISHLQDRTNHHLWLYFGTGRYFYKIGTNIDDANTQQRIYGVKDPCYDKTKDKFNSSCTSSVSSLTDSSSSPPTTEPTNDGWFITLDCNASDPGCTQKGPTGYVSERVVTNPLAAFTSAVFFTTFAPTSNVCGYSGNSYLWAIDYRTGGQPLSSALTGTALIQVSTGEIKELPLSTAFTTAAGGGKQGRRTAAFQGVPPKGQGLSIVINARPLKKILHIQEK